MKLIALQAPLSETIGRQIPFFAAFILLAAFSAGCAGAQTIEALLVQRFFAGACGSAPLTNAGGVISDMFDSSQRGIALCIFSATPYLGTTSYLINRSCALILGD
jgi:MFS family permease